jgi:glycosyltransferase involved in cell wall biosynthesis
VSAERAPITAIILTYNESANMLPCLAGLAGVDDIVVLDSGSTDDTLDQARRARSDVRVYTNPFKDFGDQRNWALDNCAPRHPWIVFVDADEYCTEDFLQELIRFVATPGDAVGAYVAGRNYFLGRWLKHTTMYPSYQLRVLKHGHVRYRKEGHGQREVTDGRCVYFKSAWHHNAFSKGVRQWVERHNEYSTNDASLILDQRAQNIDYASLFLSDPIRRRRALKQLGARVPLRPIVRFLYSYVLRGGFLDGKAGLYYCALRFAQDIHIAIKIAELRHLSRSKGAAITPSGSQSSDAA